MKIALVLMVTVLSLSGVLISAGSDTKITASSFDMRGTITNVLSPSNIVIGKEVVKLDGVDASGIWFKYPCLMDDLRYYIGKDVFVKGNYVYFDLHGAYNSESINKMIQKDILELRKEQDYGWFYQPIIESNILSI